MKKTPKPENTNRNIDQSGKYELPLSIFPKFDQIVNSIQKEGGSELMGEAINEEETISLFQKKDWVCLINFETDTKGITLNNGIGNGFFCKLNDSNIPFQKALFTNNHVLNEKNIKKNKKIKLKYKQNKTIIEKIMEISEKRKTYTNAEIDYTCVEIFDEDEINNFFEIDKDIIVNKWLLTNQEIFILQYNKSKELVFSPGKILKIEDNKMLHYSITGSGSSGSPLIRRRRDELKYIVGIHMGTIKNNKYANIAITFDSIIEDLKLKIIKQSKIKIIAHIKITKDKHTTRIIGSYEEYERDNEKDIENDEEKKKINDVKYKIDSSNLVKNEEEIKNSLIFIDKKKIDFKYKYTFNKGNHEIIYIFHNLLTATNFMFYKCTDLCDIDLSNFNTKNVTNMSFMFHRCESLTSLKLANLNTEKVRNMSGMFNECEKIKELDLSSFKTQNVKDMSQMFDRCLSLEKLDISTFNTENVTNMQFMFWKCKKLEKLDLSHFRTGNVENMHGMFCKCFALKQLDVSNFNTEKVIFMIDMFHECEALENLNLKSFNVKNCKNILGMFSDCTALVKLDISNFDTKNIEVMTYLFSGSKNLKKDQVKTHDKRIKNYFN